MKAVILAGGRGTRLSEETQFKPKPMVEACGQPLIWHIMQNYSRFGITDFIVLTGYKGQQLREYFANYWLNNSDITFDLSKETTKVHKVRGLPWNVSVIDTGLDTNTGGRILQIKNLVDADFLLTYGDGVADVDINELINSHNNSDNVATLTAVRPPARFGALEIEGNQIIDFREKSESDSSWINGGFFLMSPKIFDFFDSENPIFELDVLPGVAKVKKLGAYKHTGLWQPVDTIRDLEKLEELINQGSFPWL